MKLVRPVGGALLALMVVLSSGADPAPVPSAFPHEFHSILFTSCAPCHDLKGSDNFSELVKVTPADCARCHDGETASPVAWTPPVPGPKIFKFSHELHVGREQFDCATCHLAEGSEGRMPDMVRPTSEVCRTCHGTDSHFAADATCTQCHDPLSGNPDLTVERIATFPHPPNHESPEFLSAHGALAGADLARCATCHARETCETCHINAAQLAPIQSLPSDSRVLAQAERITPRWPKPSDHADPKWLQHHGPEAGRAIERCANCHQQSSCTTCHGMTSLAQATISRLPLEGTSRATGVSGAGGARPYHPAGFRLGHGPEAASGKANCTACHREQEFCGGCHEGTVSTGFHPPGYLNRHAADAYARDTDCAGCHSNEVSCRGCHENAGLAGFESKSASYHDAQPFWLLAHGQAARQGLDTCTSCHQQTDCLQCHSAKSGWRINPHGDAFDADRLSDQAPLMCSRCHLSDPVPGAGRERVIPR